MPRSARDGSFLVVLLAAVPGWGLDPAKALTQYRHDVWQSRDGLPQSSVESIVQTRTGYLWLGTQEGLARFDGVRFAVYDKSNTDAIHHNRILALLEDRRGSLWIGTEGGGLVEHRDGRFRNLSKSDGLPDERVLALAEDHEGRLWVGTGGGLGCYRGDMERTSRALHEAEEQREIAHAAKTEAEAANRIKSWFVANTSHELRTPINSVLGYSEMLIEEAEESRNLAAIPDLRKIHAAGRHLLGLINDILDLSKIEAGKLDLRLDTFELGALVEEVAATVRPLIEKNGNAFTVDGTDAAGSICADPARARQILLNLLSNAAKFTRDGDVRLEVKRETKRVLMRVIDTGIGMTSDQLGRLFQAYSQAEADTSRKYGGTGLGLVISRRLAQMMGGEISVESEPGKGSVFTLTLPALAPQGDDRDRVGGRIAAGQESAETLRRT